MGSLSSGKPRKQFSRPSIDLDSPSRPREHRQVEPHTLKPGDIVADMGLVEQRIELDGGVVQIVFLSGIAANIPADYRGEETLVLAFVEKL